MGTKDRSSEWFKIYAGDEAGDLYGTYQYLPQDTLTAIAEDGIAIKGPLTTPIGGGIRSLNVARRQIFNLLISFTTQSRLEDYFQAVAARSIYAEDV